MLLRSRFIKQSLILLLGLFSATALAAPYYKIKLLGPSEQESWGMAINDSGVVVGKTLVDSNVGKGFTSLGDAFSFLEIEGEVSIARAINSHGLLGGSWGTHTSFERQAFTYQNGLMATLLPLPDQTSAKVYGLNDSGMAVGESNRWATVWIDSQPLQILGTNSPSTAWDVNNAGLIVGEMNPLGTPLNQPFSYLAGQLRHLLVPTTHFGGAGYSVNEQGHIAGWSYDSDQVEHAILWRDTGPIDLGNLGIGSGSGLTGAAKALGVNSLDQVVGVCLSGKLEDGAAFLWEKGLMVDLNTRVVDANGWWLLEARAINDYGEIVATAWDTVNHRYQACLLTPVPQLLEVTVDPASVYGGTPTMGRVTMSAPSRTESITVRLMSSDTAVATVPATIIVAPGWTTATFPVNTTAVTVDKNITVMATYGANVTGALTVKTTKPFIDGFLLSGNTVYSKQPVVGTITLRTPAPSGGVKVTLTNTKPTVATVPTSVTIPAGQRSKTFNINAATVTSPVQTMITATLPTGSLQQPLTVTPIVLESLILVNSSATGGAQLNALVMIPVTAPSGGYKVMLTSANTSVATVPAFVMIPTGSKIGNFKITTKSVTGTSFSQITATMGPSQKSAQVQVLPPEVSAFTLSPATTRGGNRVTGRVTLTGKAAAGGVTVHLQSSSSSASPPLSVTVPANATSVTFNITTSAVPSTTSVSLTARVSSVTRAALLTLNH